jgi:hypothetical protein
MLCTDIPDRLSAMVRQRNQQLGDYGFGVSYTDLAAQLSPRLADDPETVIQLCTMLTRIMRRARPEARMICSLILKISRMRR